MLPDACLFTVVEKDFFEEPSSSVSVNSLVAHEEDENVPNETSLDDLCAHNESTGSESVLNLSQITEQPSGAPCMFKVLPLPLAELYSEEYRKMSSQSLSEKAKEIFRSLSYSQEQCDEIEKRTQLQRACPDWHKQRQGRLTASNFHDVLVKRKQSNCTSLLKKILSQKDISHIPAIRWGIEHEEDGRSEYINQMRISHQQFECRSAGLVVNPLFPQLGASPDGFTKCECCGTGLVEIKCPFSCKEGVPDDLIGRRGSFMNQQGLVKGHRYYTQVQGQLSICGEEFCDFVVWTPKKTFVQRIHKDFPFIEKLQRKLTTFYVDHMLPELMTHLIQEPPSDCDTSTKLYCFCQEEEYGSMIQCSNTACPYEWFHFQCVGVVQAPAGSWYCSECQD